MLFGFMVIVDLGVEQILWEIGSLVKSASCVITFVKTYCL